MKKKNRALFAIFALLVVIGGTAFLFRNLPPTIPPFDEALFIHLGVRDVETVEINKEDLGQLRQILEATNIDRFPMKWAVSGALELRANGTTVSTIQMFSNPNGSGPLEIADSYYLGYDQESFQKILGRSKSADIP